MPSIHYLNPPPNPFWDFVAGLEDHPFFTGRAGQNRPPTYTSRENVAQPEAGEASGSGAAEKTNEKATDKEANPEDPPEVDPATLNNANDDGANRRCRGRGRFAHAFEEGQDGSEPRRGPGCRGRGGFRGHGGPPHHRPGPWGGPPPPFMHGMGPWWARNIPGADGDEHPQPHEDPHHRGPGPHHHRGGGPGPWFRGRGGHPCRRRSPGGPGEGFDLPAFLNKLGNKLGLDLSGAAEGLGLNAFSGPRANLDSDFEPRGDIFDTPAAYIIHVSLPGAKKSDVGVDWDGEHSVLRVAGVVHRPGADEELLSQLAVDQRKREVGVFEKSIRLGTKREPANIDVQGISAKMVDGVLVVKVPKVEPEVHKTREVPISGTSPVRQAAEKEKESLLDAHDEEMYDADTVVAAAPAVPGKEKEMSEKEMIAQNAYQPTPSHDTRSETMEVESHGEKAVEANPAATAESDWEKDSTDDDDEEGEYVKINVE